MAALYFTAHYNWAWVVKEAVNTIRLDLKLENVSYCDKFRDLPSVQASEVKLRATYSLFRLDFSCSASTGLSLVRTRSDIFGFLDPKDSLCRICQLLGVTNFMPDTLLIPWNWSISSIDSNLYSQIVEHLRYGPKLLKAPLGSGGFGLYFVHSIRDVDEIVRNHAQIAQAKAGFMEDLSNSFYGISGASVLSWSLQDVISGVRVRSPDDVAQAELELRRCQVRAYVVMVNGSLYLYDTYEVRLPCWDADLDAQLSEEFSLFHDNSDCPSLEATHQPQWATALENTYCGSGHGRPYNEGRNKAKTERYVLSELAELAGSERAITTCMKGLFGALKPVVLERQRRPVPQGQRELSHVFDTASILHSVRSAIHFDIAQPGTVPGNSNLAEVAVVGVDLVLTRFSTVTEQRRDFAAHVVEINNNPAMPAAQGKHMSQLYRLHLLRFVSSTMQLALIHTSGGNGDVASAEECQKRFTAL